MKVVMSIIVALVVSGCVQPLKSLKCDTDHSNGHIVMSWENGEKNYKKINIEVGEQTIELDGQATSYEYENDVFGLFEFELYGLLDFKFSDTIYEIESPIQSCSSDVGRLIWDEDTSGRVTGYHVYIWNENEESPHKTKMNHSIGVVQSITLKELYEVGALPQSKEVAQFKIALSAHDNEGNVSDLSEVVSFPWKTLLRE